MIQLKQIVFGFALLLPLLLEAQKVSNIEVLQKGDRIEVSYSIDKEADIYLSTVIDGHYHFCKSVTGDVGKNISAGRRTLTWNVLEDMESFIGEAYFEVHASQSTHNREVAAAKQQKEEQRAQKMKDITPLAGFDINGGFYGVGTAVYWPWVTGKPSRVGSYISYIYGMRDWKDSSVDGCHHICLGATVTVSEHVALFAAPGLAITTYDEGDRKYAPANSYSFAAEGGICFKLLVFTLSAKYAYPNYIGFGLGLDFSWIH